MKPPCDEGVIRSRECSGLPPRSSNWILAATILGSSMAFIDGSVVNVALPALQAQLNASVVDVQWVIESYALFLAALLLVGGSLGDAFGRRRWFVIGTVIFALASIWCGLAQDIRQLIIARSVQGVGAALLVPGSLAIISATFPEGKRGQAIGTWSGFTAITAAIGPVLGGWLIENVSWRAVFFLNVPVAAAVIGITLVAVPETRDRQSVRRIDWTGALLATCGLGLAVYSLIESSPRGIWDTRVDLAFVSGCLLLALFVLVESRTKSPMVPLELFRSGDFRGANVLTLLLYSALGGAFFFIPLNLIQVQGYRATAAGAALLPFVLLLFLLSRWSGGLVARYGSKGPLVLGPLVAAAGFALFVRPGADAESYWSNFFPAVIVLGLGMAISVAPLTTTVMNAVAQDRAGIASGINNAVSRAAGLLAIAILGIVMQQAFNNALTRRLDQLQLAGAARETVDSQRGLLGAIDLAKVKDPELRVTLERIVKESFVSGFRRVMLCSAILALLSSLSALFMIGGTLHVPSRVPRSKKVLTKPATGT